MPIWGVVNQKGGVGKTTTAINLSFGLSLNGAKVLLVDCDPQGNASTGLGVDKQNCKSSLFEVLVSCSEGANETVVRESIVKVSPNLHLIPASLDLAGAESMLSSVVGKERILKEALDMIRAEYDWIILDGPPSLGLLTVNILAASSKILVPMQCEFFALEGLAQLMKSVELVKKRVNPDLEVAKIVFTMVDDRQKLAAQVQEEVQQFFGSKVSPVRIPRNVKLSEATSFGLAAVEQFPMSKGAQAYIALANEVEKCAAL